MGKSGLRVSVVGLGCNNIGWTIDEATSHRVVGTALELGVNFLDTADFYGDPPGTSEAVLGKILGSKRRDIVLATKFGVPLEGETRFNNSRRFILDAIEGSLKRLRTDWIDVYTIHWPDPSTPMEETLRALDDLVRAGKVRYIACSNLASWKVVEALWTSRTAGLHRFIAAQNEYSLLSRGIERDLIPALEAYDLGLIPYFPLASGMLTGKYLDPVADVRSSRLTLNLLGLGNQYLSESNMLLTKQLNAFAAERGHSLLELALSWLASMPLVSSIIAGATTPAQVEANVRACEWKITPDEMTKIDQLTAR
jgi:aryl-alcohol dehydrogenase-like predicted oxidoreductase